MRGASPPGLAARLARRACAPPRGRPRRGGGWVGGASPPGLDARWARRACAPPSGRQATAGTVGSESAVRGGTMAPIPRGSPAGIVFRRLDAAPERREAEGLLSACALGGQDATRGGGG